MTQVVEPNAGQACGIQKGLQVTVCGTGLVGGSGFADSGSPTPTRNVFRFDRGWAELAGSRRYFESHRPALAAPAASLPPFSMWMAHLPRRFHGTVEHGVDAVDHAASGSFMANHDAALPTSIFFFTHRAEGRNKKDLYSIGFRSEISLQFS